MLSSICVATTTGLPAARALPTICFCSPGTRSTGISTPRSPRATISPSEWATMLSRSVIAAGFSILDISAGGLADELARELHVLAALHERQRHPVDAEAQREIEVLLVLVGERPDRQHGVGQADALAARQRAADQHGGIDARGALLGHAHADLAVVEQQRVPGLDRLEDLRMRQEHALGPAVALRADRSGRWRPRSRRRARRRYCRRGTSGPAGRTGCRSAARSWPRPLRTAACTFFTRSKERVAHVDAEHVDARLEQALDHLGGVRRRSEGGDDLDAPRASHLGLAPPSLGSVRRMVQSLASCVSTSKKPVPL